ncbi:MAG: mycothiol transferase [Mycobacteriales bacterium]
MSRSEKEFTPGPDLTVERTVAAYRKRGEVTDGFIRASPSLAIPCQIEAGVDLRWVVLHLINETARHAGHADAVRELLDGATGE